MERSGLGIVSLTVFLPAIGALLLMLMPGGMAKPIKWIGTGFSALAFLASLLMLARFHGGTYHFQMVEFIPWIESAGINYIMGVDGISIWLVVLSTFLTLICCWVSFYVRDRVKAYFVFMLLLETAVLGVFCSLDLILFYTFFEASLIPMYFLIAIWGGEQKKYASLKFFIYTFAASIFMLVGMVWMALHMRDVTGSLSFNLLAIQSAVASGEFWADAMRYQGLIFWAFAIAFMVKCPMFPFHTWLPDAHTEAPTAGSIILAGVLLKMGTYGFLRMCLPLFPEAVRANVTVIMALAVVGIVYGAIVAAMQPDIKRLVAYSSVAHMGFVMLGIFSLTYSGLIGGAYQQLNHGITTSALFLLIGLLYERMHTRKFSDLGGIKSQMPVFAALFLIMVVSSVGLPGTNGFIGEFLALMGAFEASIAGAFGLNIWYSVIAGTGVILASVYLLWMFQKTFYGPITNPIVPRLKDLKTHEVVMVGTLVVLVFWGGLYPATFLEPMEASVAAVRHMALEPAGQRPDWLDLSTEIDPGGALVRTEPRNRDELYEYRHISTITPPNLHFESPDERVARRIP